MSIKRVWKTGNVFVFLPWGLPAQSEEKEGQAGEGVGDFVVGISAGLQIDIDFC